MFAYPLMLQMRIAVDIHPRSRSRALDLYDFRGRIIRVFNHMTRYIHDFPTGVSELEAPDVLFLLGGYSWKKSNFVIWVLHYDSNSKQFAFRTVSPWRGIGGKRKAVFIGNNENEMLAYDAAARLRQILKERRKLTAGGLDMEPFEVLRDMLREGKYDSIGGPPQIVKVYRYLNSMPYAVYWPNRESDQITVLGRPLLDYETLDYPILDPDTLEIERAPLHRGAKA